ncbi:MAG: hypothetical protein ACFB0D_16290 [Phormidesmis sp.]
MKQPLHTLDISSTPSYRHTRKTLQVETGSTPKTIRSWITKAGVTGEVIDGTERFTNEQREAILSQQVKRKQAEVIEAELLEPGAIELHQAPTTGTAPLIRFELPELQLSAPTADTSEIDAHTAQLEQVAEQGANAIAAALSARFDVGLAQIVAKQDNLLRGIEAQALNGAAQSLARKNNA